MDAMTQPISQVVELLHEDIFKAVEPLGETEINWTHPQLSNSIGILLRHIAASERYWIGEVVGGRPLHRQRETEFEHEQLQKAPLGENLRRAHAEVEELWRSLTAADLAASIEVEARGGTRRRTKAGGIVHAVQHTADHLGQIQLFKRMAAAPTTTAGRRG